MILDVLALVFRSTLILESSKQFVLEHSFVSFSLINWVFCSMVYQLGVNLCDMETAYANLTCSR